MNFTLRNLPLERICGLRPDLWLSVGSGYAREDIKSLILSQGFGFVGDAIVTTQDLCLKITGIDRKQILGTFSRQEVLRILLSEPKILAQIPEIKRLKRQRNFLKRLDQAIQQGRLAFAHDAEEEVYEERLNQVLGNNPLRIELSRFAKAYEAWLESSGYFDIPLLLRRAIDVLRDGWPLGIKRPREIWLLSAQTLESLEKQFWDTVGQWLDIKHIQLLDHFSPRSIQWERWHTLDDAAEHLAEQLSKIDSIEKFRDHAVIIPDLPHVRRTLKRAFEARQIPLSEPRDPTRLRWDEAVKWAMLPLEIVARNYERQKVIAWLRGKIIPEKFPQWTQEIHARGIRHGLYSYAGGALDEVHQQLLKLDEKFYGRKRCEDLGKNHIEFLESQIHFKSEYFWLIEFFEQIWKDLQEDLNRVAQSDRKAPPLFWLEKLQTRLREATPPVDRLKPREGVQIFRLQQAPLFPVQNVWFFGLPAQWLDGRGSGSYWFTEREREVLSSEFAVRSLIQVREERFQLLKAWILRSADIYFLDYVYDCEGKEKESIRPILQELELHIQASFPKYPDEKGAHPRFIQSYGTLRPIPPQEVQLSSLFSKMSQSKAEMSATALDRYSRCSFQALAFHRWNLSDLREPGTELWPEVKGNLLHESVRLLMKSLNSNLMFTRTPREAIEEAWMAHRPRGLLRSKRVEDYVKSRLCMILEAFCIKEKEYLKRSQARPISLDQQKLKLEFSHFIINGKPDRIDQHSAGLFIIDYKTSGTVPNGSEMVEQGYRLQLPFYALAVQETLTQPALGVQFVELDRKAGRRSGIFFDAFNGKSPGSLTQVRSNSKSLISADPQEVWKILRRQIEQDAIGYLEGRYKADPKINKKERECQRCAVSDLCGMRRAVCTGAGDE